MAKELPYFQFEPAEYLTKDISFCSLSSQGLFINICSYYWQRGCNLTKDQLLKRLNYPEELEELISEDVLKIEDNRIIIVFLDEQHNKATKLSDKNSSNGRKGGKPALSEQLTSIFGDTIPRETNEEDHYFYMFFDTLSKSYKVGETQDLFKRRLTIKVPTKNLQIIHFVKIEKQDNLTIENNFKNTFKNNNIKGDYFSFNKSELQGVYSYFNSVKIPKKYQKNTQLKGIREDKIIRDNIKEDKNKGLMSEVSLADVSEKNKDYFEVGKSFYDLINLNLQELNFPLKNIKNSPAEKWLDSIRLMVESDGVTTDQCRSVFQFLKTSEFWKPNVQTSSKLRKNFSQIYGQSKRNEKSNSTKGKTIASINREINDDIDQMYSQRKPS